MAIEIPAPLRQLVEEAPIPVTVADPNADGQPLILANDAFTRLCGYERSEILGRNCRFLQGPDTDQAVRRRLARALVEGRDIACTLRNYTKRGEPFDNLLIVRHLWGGLGDPKYLIGCQFFCKRGFDEMRLREHVEDESALSQRFRQVVLDTHRAVDQNNMLAAQSLFALAIHQLRRVENQAVLASRGFERPVRRSGSEARP